MKYCKKASKSEIEAFQWFGDERQIETPDWFLEAMHGGIIKNSLILEKGEDVPVLKLYTINGTKIIFQSDYIIKDEYGDIYSKTQEIFEDAYEKVGDQMGVDNENFSKWSFEKQIDFILNDLRNMLIQKNHDYGDSVHKQYLEYGDLSLCLRIEDKLNRLKKLSKSEAQVKDESKLDTLMDSSGYGVLGVRELLLKKENK